MTRLTEKRHVGTSLKLLKHCMTVQGRRWDGKQGKPNKSDGMWPSKYSQHIRRRCLRSVCFNDIRYRGTSKAHGKVTTGQISQEFVPRDYSNFYRCLSHKCRSTCIPISWKGHTPYIKQTITLRVHLVTLQQTSSHGGPYSELSNVQNQTRRYREGSRNIWDSE